MARIAPSIDAETSSDNTSNVVTAAGVIGALYFGSEILIPLALAILLSFALAPAVKVLQKLGLGRIFPVLVTVLVAFVLLTGLAALLGTQLRDLSTDLPRYQGPILHKIDTVKELTNSGGLRKLQDLVGQFSKAVEKPEQGGTPQGAALGGESATPAGRKPAAAEQKSAAPMLVQVVQPALGPLDAIVLVATPLLHPLATAVIVFIFVVFILLQREDLRNRAIRLFGASDLHRATAAINDGAKRLSRYLLTQLAVNLTAGIVVGVTVAMIGVPSPVLIGIMFALSRFIPYIGAVLGALLPLLLATAVDPGWSMVAWTGLALVVIELVVGQAVEPFAYGHNTGLSPIAVVVAATFWTALWGPIGLLLSTPLTVCLVVLGRHVESLSFLDVLLGDRPPLTPAETFYQRMLANDPIEAADQAQRCLAEMPLDRYYDDVALPALIMAQDDVTQGRIDLKRQPHIATAAMEVVDDLDQGFADEAAAGAKPGLLGFGKPADGDREPVLDDLVPERVPAPLKEPGSVLCIGARGPLDDAAAAMLAQVFRLHGIGAVSQGFVRLSKNELPTLDVSKTRMIVLSSLDGSSPAFLRFILRRLRRHASQSEIIVGAWWQREGHQDSDAEMDAVIGQAKVATFLEAVRQCFAERPAPAGAEAASAPALSAVS